jgi:raffinose/stachyose/melibiose transport system permease protein
MKYGISHLRYTSMVRTIVYLPVVIPSVAAAALFSKIYEITPQYGLLNSLLTLVGLDSMVEPWLGLSRTALWAVCFAEMWKGIGYYAIIFYAGLLNVPQELEEAARIDGAGLYQIIKDVVMPIIRPVNIMCVVLTIMNALRVYDMPRVLTKGGPGYATTTLSIYMYKIAFKQWEYGYGSTIAIVALLLTLIFTQLVILLDNRRKEW